MGDINVLREVTMTDDEIARVRARAFEEAAVLVDHEVAMHTGLVNTRLRMLAEAIRVLKTTKAP